mgnify:CR=1 FL=1
MVVKEGASIIADYDVNFFSLSPIENIRLDKSEISLEPGKNARLHADISPIKAEEEPIRWASSDSSVVKVSKYGKITALKEGSAASHLRCFFAARRSIQTEKKIDKSINFC